MKILSLILTICLPTCLFAQNLNPQQPDSIYKLPVHFRTAEGHPRIQSFIMPAVLLGYGFASLGNNAIRRLDYSTQAELQEDHSKFAKNADDYLRFAPAAAFYALNLAGVKSKHGVADGTGLLVLSQAFMSGSTFFVKKAVSRTRPDNSDHSSFPSGHTATAFASAEFLYQEYHDVSPWIGYAGYTIATATGVFRLYNNRHWVSDIVAGAGFGIASAKLAYLVYPHLKKLVVGKQTMTYSVVPLYQQKAAGISFSGTF